jgi:hypothetical protein
MARAFAFGSLIVLGLMLANVVTHPVGTGVLVKGAEGLSRQTGNQLLGKAA